MHQKIRRLEIINTLFHILSFFDFNSFSEEGFHLPESDPLDEEDDGEDIITENMDQFVFLF